MPTNDSLFDGSNTKAPNLAVLIFLIFALLWLILAAIAIGGVALAPETGGINLIMGTLAVLAMALLASRVQLAPLGATVLGVLILIAPYVVGSLGMSVDRSSARSKSNEELAAALALPPSQRSSVTVQAAATMKAHGYEEAPEIAKIIAERPDQIKTWLRENSTAVQALEARVSKKASCQKYASRQAFQDDLLAYLLAPKAYAGTNWVWFGLWLEEARALGFKDEPLTAEQTTSAAEYARNWLDSHSEVNVSNAVFTMSPEIIAMEEQETTRPVNRFSMVSFWIVLFGVGAAWAGRNSFTRPWDLFQFPGWALGGLRRLIRKDRFAVLRILCGLAGMALVMAVMVWMIFNHYQNRAVGKFMVGLTCLAGLFACSGLSFGEEEAR